MKEILSYSGYNAEIVFYPNTPTGSMNWLADNSLVKRLIKWKPEVSFIEGLHHTINWYLAMNNRKRSEQFWVICSQKDEVDKCAS